MKKISIIIVIAMLFSVCAIGFVACNKVADNTEHLTAVTKTLKLTKAYEGKNLFSDDGIGEAELLGENDSTTDGDTTYFGMKVGSSVNVRYQGVDTPESTAGVEKWGKSASKFTNERLHEATAIVIQSTTGKTPANDSTSSNRYMCYVWYKTADHDFYLLNLELVENGFSRNKEDATSAYYSYFQKAEQAARKIQLRLWSKLDDPLYSDKVIDASIKDIKENPDNYSEIGRVRLEAYVSNRTSSSSGSRTYTIAQLDRETGTVYEMSLFAGYNGYATTLVVGELYQLVGFLQKHDGSWQLSGVQGNDDKKDDPDTSWRKQYSYCIWMDPSINLYKNKISSNAYKELTVTDVKLDGTTLTFAGTSLDCNGDSLPEGATFTVTVPSNYNGQIKVGSTLVIRCAYRFSSASYEFTVLSYSDIAIK